MHEPPTWHIAAAPEPANRRVFDEGLRQHMLRVYNYMGLGLVRDRRRRLRSWPRRRRSTCRSSPAPLKWVVMLAPLAFVLLFSFRIQTMSAAARRRCSGLSAR